MWARYDGRRRNPYNEIECGDHYARAMAGWSVLEALAGFRHDAHHAAVELRHPREAPAALPFLASEGWGMFEVEEDELRVRCTGGRLEVGSLAVVEAPWEAAETIAPAGSAAVEAGTLRCTFAPVLTLETGEALTLRRARAPEQSRDKKLEGTHA
jgi:hypothetical protein